MLGTWKEGLNAVRENGVRLVDQTGTSKYLQSMRRMIRVNVWGKICHRPGQSLADGTRRTYNSKPASLTMDLSSPSKTDSGIAKRSSQSLG